MSLIDELENQRELAKALCQEIDQDEELHAYVKKRVGPEIYRFFSDLISTMPRIALIIDSISPKLDQALTTLNRIANTEVVEFKTYVREGTMNVRAHVFEPLHISPITTKIEGRYLSEAKPPTEKSTKYRQFHEAFLRELKTKYPAITKTNRVSDGSWWGTSGGKTGFALYTFFRKEGGFTIGYWIDTKNEAKNKEYYDTLAKSKSQIEKEVGEPLDWYRMDGKRACWIGVTRPTVTINADKQSLGTLISWGTDMLAKLRSAIIPRTS
jgi:hypothetical protein